MKKVGIIDSGIGGLSILAHLLRMQNQCEFFYQSDHSNVPYGGKEQDFMLTQTVKMVDKLLEQDVELVILACNTLTAETIDILRAKYPVPFVGIEPFVNFINTNLYREDQKVGLILTPATAKSARFKTLKEKHDPSNKVEVIPLSRLALIIEDMSATKIEDHVPALKNEMKSVEEHGLDVLLYGCTHYPLVSNIIEDHLDVKVYDPHIPVSKRVLEVLSVRETTVPDFKTVTFNYAPEIDSKWCVRKLSDFEFFK